MGADPRYGDVEVQLQEMSLPKETPHVNIILGDLVLHLLLVQATVMPL